MYAHYFKVSEKPKHKMQVYYWKCSIVKNTPKIASTLKESEYLNICAKHTHFQIPWQMYNMCAEQLVTQPQILASRNTRDAVPLKNMVETCSAYLAQGWNQMLQTQGQSSPLH